MVRRVSRVAVRVLDGRGWGKGVVHAADPRYLDPVPTRSAPLTFRGFAARRAANIVRLLLTCAEALGWTPLFA